MLAWLSEVYAERLVRNYFPCIRYRRQLIFKYQFITEACSSFC